MDDRTAEVKLLGPGINEGTAGQSELQVTLEVSGKDRLLLTTMRVNSEKKE